MGAKLSRHIGAICLTAAMLGTGAGAFAQSRDDGAKILGENLLLRCEQPAPASLECDYRLVQPGKAVAVRAGVGEVELPAPDFFKYPQPGSVSLVMFLIDTSDPRRAPAVAAAVRHIRQILASAEDHHLFGLATFDAKLRVVVDPGASAQTIVANLATVRADGRTTELYRNTLAAVNLAGAFPASRRSVVIFSDGQAEDQAYFHSDVIQAARAQGVSIDGLGYPRSVALSVALQTLRRLAEESGGRFVEGSPSFALSGNYLAAPFASLDSGGTLILDLTPAIQAGANGRATVGVELQLEAGQAAARVSVALPEPEPVAPLPPLPPVPEPAPVIATAPEPATSSNAGSAASRGSSGATSTAATTDTPSASTLASISTTGTTATGSAPQQTAASNTLAAGSSATAAPTPPSTTTPTPSDSASQKSVRPSTTPSTDPFSPTQSTSAETSKNRPIEIGGLSINVSLTDLLTYVAVFVGVVMILLIIVLVRVVRRRNQGNAAAARGGNTPAAHGAPANDDIQVFAFLDALDGSGERHSITSAAFRIGRHADNELPISDASMSRHHAQIQLKRDGTFLVTDLESMNGVFVNEKRITSSPVKHGDLVELGDVRMRFGVTKQDSLRGDETVMVRTALPGDLGNHGAA